MSMDRVWKRIQGSLSFILQDCSSTPFSLLGELERLIENGYYVIFSSQSIVLHHPILWNPPALQYELHHLRGMDCNRETGVKLIVFTYWPGSDQT